MSPDNVDARLQVLDVEAIIQPWVFSLAILRIGFWIGLYSETNTG